MADYVSPEARRRIAGGLMAAQYNRATPEEGNVAQRHGLLPLANYDNGRTGLAFPGFVAEPVQGFVNELYNPTRYVDRSEDEKRQTVENSFNTAGASMMGGLAAPKPKAFQASRNWYHGTPESYDKFSLDPVKNSGERDIALAFSNRPEFASEYAMGAHSGYPNGSRVIPAKIDSRNPMRVNQESWGTRGENADLIEKAKSLGHDSIEFTYTHPSYVQQYGEPLRESLVWNSGTVRSPLTGELLFSNGGRGGAATGAALGAIPDTPGIRAYHGTTAKPFDTFSDPPFLTKDPNIAAIYAAGEVEPANYVTFPWQRHARIIPAELRAKNMLEFDHINMPNVAKNLGIADPAVTMTDMIAGANANGYDALAMKINDLGGEQTQYIPTRRGTVYSPTTGDLLYANGGRPGAGLGELLSNYYGTEPSQPRPWNQLMKPGDA